MAEQTVVRLTNKAAHVKYIALAGGATITVPPTEEGRPGIEVRFDSDDERRLFERALEQPTTKAWIASGELEITTGTAAAHTPTPHNEITALQPTRAGSEADALHDDVSSRTAAQPVHRRDSGKRDRE